MDAYILRLRQVVYGPPDIALRAKREIKDLGLAGDVQCARLLLLRLEAVIRRVLRERKAGK